MTLTFKDPNGVEWRVIAEHNVDHECPLKRPATTADLLAALGQLSTGSDGPSDEELWRIDQAALAAVPDDASVHETNTAALRALFAAGRASAESELAATKAKLAEVMKRHRGCAAVRAERDAFRADLEQMRDLLPNDWQTQTELGGQVMIELKKQRDEAARLDEKLAEVEREAEWFRKERSQRVTELLDLSEERNQLRTKLAEVERERDETRSYLPLDEPDGPLPRRVLTIVEDLRYVRSELASARRVVEAARSFQHSDEEPWMLASHLVACRVTAGDVRRLRDALASAGTHADRTEAPRPVERRYRHKKRGTTYDVIAEATDEASLLPVVVYRGVADGRVWVRPLSQFYDGRFEAVPNEPQLIASEGDPSLPKLESGGGVQEKMPPGFLDACLSSDGKGTLCLGAAGFTTVRACRRCGVLIAGGPTACLFCAQAEEPKPEPPRPEAGESEDVLGKFDRIREELEEQGVRIRASEWLEPPEEPKPEPQPSGEEP